MNREQRKNLREHLNMMLEAMQYKESTRNMPLDDLRSLVEREKLVFLRKLEGAQGG